MHVRRATYGKRGNPCHSVHFVFEAHIALLQLQCWTIFQTFVKKNVAACRYVLLFGLRSALELALRIRATPATQTLVFFCNAPTA